MNHTYLRGDMYYADLGRGYRLRAGGLSPRRDHSEQCREQTQPHGHMCSHYLKDEQSKITDTCGN